MNERPDRVREFMRTVERFVEGEITALQFQAEYLRVRENNLEVFIAGFPESEVEASVYSAISDFVGEPEHFNAAAGNINAAELKWHVSLALNRYRAATE